MLDHYVYIVLDIPNLKYRPWSVQEFAQDLSCETISTN